MIGNINISSIRNKFSSFKDLVLKETDICLLPETKIDDSFPNSKFFTEGYIIFQKDRNKNVGGLILYMLNEGILGKLINSYDFKEGSEIIVFEFSISNEKWLLPGNYKPPSQNELFFINEIKLSLNFFGSSYESFLLLGDFNLSTEIQISKTYSTALI